MNLPVLCHESGAGAVLGNVADIREIDTII